MRKIVAVLIIILVVTVYVVAIRKNVKKDTPAEMTEVEAVEEIVEETVGEDVVEAFAALTLEDVPIATALYRMQRKIEANYPSTPKEVITLYNEIMALQYSEEMLAEDITMSVDTMRLLYSEALLEVNPYNEQVYYHTEELAYNTLNQFYITGTQIETIEFIEDYTIAVVDVIYTTTKDPVERLYRLYKSEDKWQILSWVDQEANTVIMSQQMMEEGNERH